MRGTDGSRAVSSRSVVGRLALLGGVIAAMSLLPTVASTAVAAAASLSHRNTADCPWRESSFDQSYSAAQLAAMVVEKMTLQDKLDVVDLSAGGGYENTTTAIPSLCIPALTLQDGPDGLSFHDKGGTQLPAAIGVAASFDPSVAQAVGEVEGNEARRQGVDVVQGPNLNIARVPEAGRTFEGFGEDPDLVSAMGDATIEGIQSQGVMADAKHFTAYTEETNRIRLNQLVSERALQEIYLPPFKSAVQKADVASIMCAYGEINGQQSCSSPSLYTLLRRSWGFTGFVRSDLMAVTDPAAAFAAGLDQIKPAAAEAIRPALKDGVISATRLDHAVERVLAEMFTYHLIDRPVRGHVDTVVTNAAHARVALQAAEESMVLLKNDGALPLTAKKDKSVAVIGVDANTEILSAGGGSAHVIASSVSNPLAALRSDLSAAVRVSYADGGSTLNFGPPIGDYPGLVAESVTTSARGVHLAPSKPNIETGSISMNAPGMQHWSDVVGVRQSGTYVISLADNGDAWLSVDGVRAISSPGLHGRAVWSISRTFKAGQKVTIGLNWYPLVHEGAPAIGWRDVTSQISQAVAAARSAKVAVVFVSALSSEGVDRPTLALPSDENALVEAVAAANPNTVVVINSGGAVLMPWLSKVAAVLEAWYPGQVDGRATAAVLVGRVDPGGRLPISFPKSDASSPTAAPQSWPGVDGTVSFTNGLDVGYRYYDATGVKPLFPFGFGLDYARFSLGQPIVSRSGDLYSVTVPVANTSDRAGSEVVQAYLSFPASAGEPPDGLIGFARIALAKGASGSVTIPIDPSAFSCYLYDNWEEIPGTYELRVGTSSADLPYTLPLSAPDLSASPTGLVGAPKQSAHEQGLRRTA